MAKITNYFVENGQKKPTPTFIVDNLTTKRQQLQKNCGPLGRESGKNNKISSGK